MSTALLQGRIEAVARCQSALVTAERQILAQARHYVRLNRVPDRSDQILPAMLIGPPNSERADDHR